MLVVGTGRCSNPAVTVTGMICPPNAIVRAPLLPISSEMVLKPTISIFPVPMSDVTGYEVTVPVLVTCPVHEALVRPCMLQVTVAVLLGWFIS